MPNFLEPLSVGGWAQLRMRCTDGGPPFPQDPGLETGGTAPLWQREREELAPSFGGFLGRQLSSPIPVGPGVFTLETKPCPSADISLFPLIPTAAIFTTP